MMGNMGIAEWIIVLFIALFLFGGPLALLLLLLARRRESTPLPPPLSAAPTPSDEAQMRRILDSLERMERRIENLETLVGQRQQ